MENNMRGWKNWLLLLSTTLCINAVRAADIAVPAPLEPWRGWVLDQHRELACPPHYANLGEHYCRWPGRLVLQADMHGASFSQDWQLYSDGWITLPGDADSWPQDVRVDEKSAAVIERRRVACCAFACRRTSGAGSDPLEQSSYTPFAASRHRIAVVHAARQSCATTVDRRTGRPVVW
jgi:hypothetical protein